ncbi:hypothetical protein Tco_1317965 [Tanacetum coccineum]
MILKSKDWVERHNPDSKLPNFNTGRILFPKSQVVNECLGLTKEPTDLESSKESGSEPLTPLPPLKNLQGASPSSEVMPLTYQDHSSRERPGLGTMKHKNLQGFTVALVVLVTEASQSRHTNLASHLPQSCLMLTLKGFPFITVNTKEYHFECSGNYRKDNA